MTSPFSFKQVFLGFQRGLEPRPKAQTTAAEVIQTGDFRINLQSRKVSVRRKEVQLTQEELELVS